MGQRAPSRTQHNEARAPGAHDGADPLLDCGTEPACQRPHDDGTEGGQPDEERRRGLVQPFQTTGAPGGRIRRCREFAQAMEGGEQQNVGVRAPRAGPPAPPAGAGGGLGAVRRSQCSQTARDSQSCTGETDRISKAPTGKRGTLRTASATYRPAMACRSHVTRARCAEPGLTVAMVPGEPLEARDIGPNTRRRSSGNRPYRARARVADARIPDVERRCSTSGLAPSRRERARVAPARWTESGGSVAVLTSPRRPDAAEMTIHITGQAVRGVR
jgi:hypothetical protein